MIKTILCFIILAVSYSAYGACSSPAGAVGIMAYRSGSYFFCDNTNNWVSMHANPSAPLTACSKPGLIVGDRFCNGTNFYSVNSLVTAGACTKNDEYRFFSGSMNICLSGTWYKTGPCPSCQLACEDMNPSECELNSGRCELNGGIMCTTIPTYDPPPPNEEN